MVAFSRHGSLNNLSYLPPGWPTYTANNFGGQRFAMWYPGNRGVTAEGPKVAEGMPDGGWPVVIVFHLTNFNQSTNAYADASATTIQFGTGYWWQLLNNGFALMHVQVTPGDAENPAQANLSGVGGKGFFNRPGDDDGTRVRWARNAYQNAFKDAIHAIQHLRYYHRTYNINPNRVGVAGQSAGGQVAAFLALSPNRACELGFGAQHNESTVPSAMFALQAPFMDFEIYDKTITGISPDFFHTSGGYDTVAASLSAAHDADIAWAGGATWCAWGAGQIAPCTIWTDDAQPAGADAYKWMHPVDGPVVDNGVATLADLHSMWHLLKLKAMYRDRVWLGLPFNILDADNFTIYDETFEGPVTQGGSTRNDAMISDFLGKMRQEGWDKHPPRSVARVAQVGIDMQTIVPPHPDRVRVDIRMSPATDATGQLAYIHEGHAQATGHRVRGTPLGRGVTNDYGWTLSIPTTEAVSAVADAGGPHTMHITEVFDA